MEPIAETRELLSALESTSGYDLGEALLRLVPEVEAIVPSLVGLSVSVAEPELTFTFVSSSQTAAVLDAVQYVGGGPCIIAAESHETVGVESALDEERWHLYAMAAAAHGVLSSLSLPVGDGSGPLGAVNLYASEPHAFDGRHDELRELLGPPGGVVVSNADLSFATREAAQAAPRRLREMDLVEQAVGYVAASQAVSVDEARRILQDAAGRARVDVAAVARAMLDAA